MAGRGLAKRINNKFDKYNLVISVFSAKDNYLRNNLLNRGIKVEYEKSDLPQVNAQLHEWLDVINGRSSNFIIDGIEGKVNTSDENYSKNGTIKSQSGDETSEAINGHIICTIPHSSVIGGFSFNFCSQKMLTMKA